MANGAVLFCPNCSAAAHRQPLDTGLKCPHCGKRWPVLAHGTDFIPVLLPDVAAAERMAALCNAMLAKPDTLGRWVDGEDALELALAGGLLTYAQAHFGAYCAPPLQQPDFGWLAHALPQSLPEGPVAILGAGPGGEAWALRDAPILSGRQTWVVDANLAALAWGQMLFDNGSVVLPYRSSATRIDFATATLPDRAPEVRWLCADALFPPFAAGSLAVVVTVGLLDSVADPFALIQQVEALLQRDGVWIMASPYNWQNRITPAKLQCERHFGEALPDGMVALLSGRKISGIGADLQPEWRDDDIVWRLQVHPRYTAEYRMQAIRLRKVA